MKLHSQNASPQAWWQNHDWQISPYAPQLRIVQAIVEGGKTASGAGFSRHDALLRCHGETAEILALSDVGTSEGVAAGPDFEFAAFHALCERLERWAIWDWWHGKLKAQRVFTAALEDQLRIGATTKRQTQLWRLPDFGPLHVIIALSFSPFKERPIMGFGANPCPETAARSALIELGLMELNLCKPSVDMNAYFKRISASSNRLFKPDTNSRYSLSPSEKKPSYQDLTARLKSMNIDFALADLSTKKTDLFVVRAHMPNAPSWADRSARNGTPLI